MVMLNDLVVIGIGAPNQLQDGRLSVCVCACNPSTKELLRIYPVPMGWFRKWDIFDVEVEKPTQDHRENTWKIKNSKEDWKRLGKWIKKHNEKYPDESKEELINSIGFSTLGDLIKNVKSFGIIKPVIKNFEIEQKNEHTVKQLTLFDEKDLDQHFAIINQKNYKFKPYLIYECEGSCSCLKKEHRQSITEWGCYEFMRKNPCKEESLKDNLRLFDKDYNKYLLVGNIHKAPQTYVIIDVLRFKKKTLK